MGIATGSSATEIREYEYTDDKSTKHCERPADKDHPLWHHAPNALSSAAAVGGRLRRTVRPEGQKGAPNPEDGRGP